MDTYGVSPNSPENANQSFVVNEQLLSQRWEHILRCKRQFLTDKNVDPRQFPEISRPVADSWLRARMRGVDPYKVVKKPQLTEQELQEIRHDKEPLIAATEALINRLKNILNDCGYILYLIDPDGIILVHEGDWKRNRPFPEYGSRVGIIANEETIGTNAHELSINLKRPVQLLGPEHYAVVFQNNIASAAPVFDADRQVAGALLLLSRPCEGEKDGFLTRQCKSELALVVSMASAVAAEMVLCRPRVKVQTSSMGKDKSVLPAVKERRPAGSAGAVFNKIIGESEAIKKAVKLARKFAQSRENILLTGESGTGKEIFAEAIHQYYCPDGPFVVVNCAAMPRDLIASELFGYEGGSFTGAERRGRPGKIELADGGIFFLDEIGDMPLELQPVLLRVLENKQVTRIGGCTAKKVDFRLIAATNQNLYQMVLENKFREDLYYRLSVLNIHIPPLRERKEDIILLCDYFIEEYCQETGRPRPQLSRETVEYILAYDWPGNVRQLKNAMIYAVNVCQGQIITPQDLPQNIILDKVRHRLYPSHFPVDSIGELLQISHLEKTAIQTALTYTNRCVPEAAKLLGLSRSTLYRKIKEYNITL